MKTPLISVVLPTFNRAKSLERCVLSVLRTLPTDAEVIVCDDGSTDSTAETIASLERADPRVRGLPGKRGGPAVARNRGWRDARGPIIAFIDDDCVAGDDWTALLLAALNEHPEWAGVEGKTSPATDKHGFFIHSIDSSAGSFLTCNLAVRREALEKIGGLDENFPFAACEDIDLCLRLEEQVGRIGFAENARVLHDCLPVGVRYYLDRVRQDGSNYRLFSRHPARFHETIARSRGISILSRFGEPMPSTILVYLIGTRLAWAYVTLRRGRDTRERAIGSATFIAAAFLSVGQLARGRREFREARGQAVAQAKADHPGQ